MSLLGERDTVETRIELFADELVDILRHNGNIDEGLIRLLESNYTHMMTFVIRRSNGEGLAVSTFFRFYEPLINAAIIVRDLLDNVPVDDDIKRCVLSDDFDEEQLKFIGLYEGLKVVFNKITVDKLHPDYILEDCFDQDGNYQKWFFPDKVSEEV